MSPIVEITRRSLKPQNDKLIYLSNLLKNFKQKKPAVNLSSNSQNAAKATSASSSLHLFKRDF